MGFSVKARVQFTPRGDLGRFVDTKIVPGAVDGTTAAAQRVLEYALQNVHVRSGELRDSGHVIPGKVREKAAVAMVVFDADHAAYNEFGTGRRGAASDQRGPGPYNEQWPGMDPIPFLRPAKDQAREDVKAEIGNGISTSVKS